MRAHREIAPAVSLDPQPGSVRVFAMQLKQEVRDVVSYGAYRTKIECMIRDYVVPRLARDRPNVVVFDEDVGLATIATGTRGLAARTIAANPTHEPSCESAGVPCGTLAAIGALDAGYAKQLAAYRTRFTGLGPISGVFVAATDTFVRGFMQTFADMARRYHVYILGSSTQARFRESSDPRDIDTFMDPDLPRPRSVYVATGPAVYNTAFLWAPRDVRQDGPPMERNLVATNDKVPLTSLEQEIGLTPGPSTGAAAIANVRPYAIPGTPARLGIATSLPAFVYGEPPAGTDPCSDTSSYYMSGVVRGVSGLTPSAAAFAGLKPQFLTLAPWVTPDASRAALRTTGAKLAPGSHDGLENDYVETAAVADLTFPADPARAGCVR